MQKDLTRACPTSSDVKSTTWCTRLGSYEVELHFISNLFSCETIMSTYKILNA